MIILGRVALNAINAPAEVAKLLKKRNDKVNRLEVTKLTAPAPSVDGPPTNAIILAPEPGTQTPNKQAAMLNAVLVHRDAR